MDYILNCNNVTKKYGSKKALDSLTLSIKPGTILGLLGPNGAGKTTLMKLIVSLLRDYRGEIRIKGLKPSVETKKIVSYLPDREFLYQWMTIEQAIAFFEHSFVDFNRGLAYKMVKSLGLDINDKIKSLSKGMQERLSISLAFARKATLYILDEPLAAVDPSTRDKIIQIILDNFDPTSAVIISTHLINDVEKLFTDVAFVNDGKVLLQGNVKDIRDEYEQSIEEIFKSMI
ncbi:ABC transporter ATP-binding protein [Paenibacillus sp. FSL M8-0228]|uniref:ABC transporter ATP-binding protein n=1 Tax=Paenibacillus TaxID=44249 RepID=UPI0004960C98|nr:MULTISPECIES: ABC transporter ATP-binding protein [Paenibacillus]MBO3283904.1 ABC transporter ATP-binding protein [Paenibacillus polymyxa]MBP1311060.1 ABC-2 type transport system ATP-binding protein [Paenibacillus sp. 1182]ODB50557.1 multidrug ABC transporter ATP-binding protein [Paenibacillus polymyxa]UMY56348.1 ABC transporter ATP-binding protein [Paenibacillus peoriae]